MGHSLFVGNPILPPLKASTCFHSCQRRFLVCSASESTLNSVSKSFKLNAVAESLARSRNVPGALATTAELQQEGEPVYPRTVSAIVDAIASSPGPKAVLSLHQLFQHSRPNGFGEAIEFTNNFQQPEQHPTIQERKLGNVSISTEADNDKPCSANADMQSNGSSIPDTNRATEMGLAGAFLTVVGTAVSAEIFEPVLWHHSADEATTVLMMVVGGLVFDRFATAGQVWLKLSRGFDRWFASDPVRDAKVDAAYFMVSYLLGIPCVPFRPDVSQVLRLHSTGRPSSRRRKVKQGGDGPTLGTDVDKQPDDATPHKQYKIGHLDKTAKMPPLNNGMIRSYTAWMLAGVAMESIIDGILVESSTSPARALLRATGNLNENSIERAFVTAVRLLTVHQVAHRKLWESMLDGLSAGECVALLDNEFAK